MCLSALGVFCFSAWTQGNTGCDVNHDGTVDVRDVQLITNMEIHAPGFPCTANIGGVLGCTESARQVVIKAALGKGCSFNYITWKPSTLKGVTGYNVYRSATTSGQPAERLNSETAVAGTSFADVTAGPNGQYHYFAKATDGAKEIGPAIEATSTAK